MATVAWMPSQPEANTAFRPGSVSPRQQSQACSKCGSILTSDAIYCRHCGHKRDVSPSAVQGRAWAVEAGRTQAGAAQLPRVVSPVALPGGQLVEPVTGVPVTQQGQTSTASTSPSPFVAASFEALDANQDGVITRAEFQQAANSGLVYPVSSAPVRSVSPAPIRGVPPFAYAAPLHRGVSPEPRNPSGQVLVAGTSPNLVQAVPVAPINTVPARLAQPAMSVPNIQVLPPSEPEPPQNFSEDLIKRIDGVVTEMERELSDDLAACVKSPLNELKTGVKVEFGGATQDEDVTGDNESTLDWIDKQIRAIEQRREACELRQNHLSDLRRLVADGERGQVSGRRLIRDEGLYAGPPEDVDAAGNSPSQRLSNLEAEHEELKKQVESERLELLKVRSNLEMECERRLEEVRVLADSVQEGRQRAIAAEEAANQRAKEAGFQVQVLQDRLREAEATLERERQQFRVAQEAQAVAGADLRQLEENSRAVLADCRALQQKVRELELERAAFLEVQAKSEEDRKAMIVRISQFEEEKSRDMESVLQHHREQWREAANRESEQMRASIEATHSRTLKDLERQTQARAGESNASLLKELEDWKAECMRLRGDCDGERRARVELEQRHAAAVEDAAKLREDQQRLQAAHAAEERAKEEVASRHQAVLVDMERMKGDKLELEKDQAAEKQARLLAEQKHAAAMEDAQRLKADQEKLHADKAAEQAARQEAERKHQSVLKDMETVRADHQRVTREKEEEARLRSEAETKHASVVKDMQRLQEDHARIKADKDAEERAKLEVQRLHEEVLREKTSGHGHLQELLDAEKRAKEEMRQRHAAVESDKQKMAQDQAQLQEDKVRESQLRAEAERKHEELLRDMQQLREDQKRLTSDKEAESQAKAEAERRHASVLQDMEKLTADKQKLEADTAAERKAREEAEKKHLEVLQDREQISSDMRALQRDKDSESLAKEEFARKHEAALKQLDLVNADQAKLRMDKEAEARARADLEAKHQAALREKDELQAQHLKVQQDRDRLAALQGNSSREHEEAYVKMKAAHEAELKQHKDSGLQLKAEWEGRHQDLLQELEKLRAEHRKLQQEKDDERRGRERVHSDHQTALRDAESIKIQLDGLQARSAGDRASLEEANSRLRTLQAERDTLAADVSTLKKLKEEKSKAEDDLRAALNEQRAEVKLLQKQLEERDHQARQFEDKRRVQEEKLSSLLSQLADEKKDAEESRRELQQVRRSGEQFQKDAEEGLQTINRDWQQKYDDLIKENQALKHAAASRARTNSDAELRRRSLAHRMSLWAEPMNFLAGLEEESPLLPGSNADIVQQVRKTHKELDENIQNATEVHIKSIMAQLEGVTAAESKGLSLRRGLTDYERKSEIESERHTEQLRLDARLHDLRALQEEVALEHSLSESDQQKIRDYLQRDMKRCEEELEILKPSSALASVPDQLIQVLQTMPEEGLPERFEHGFSPLHWAAQQGRRDIVEFIRRLVEGGHGLLASRDDQGRTPLFYAEREGRTGLAYHLRRVGGSAEDPFRPAVERPHVDSLPAAYQQVLRQVETRGWHSMKWKEDYTMLHWAANKGHKDLALYLISLNANPNALDSKRRSPAACASEAGHTDLVALLQAKATVPRKSIGYGAFGGGFETE
ncbi:unnamed protein product [Symbiodinium natans]|uniref:EF-hand domain-containing protein n=1 Tax=Symbiodinium natans TaxID=878477 RepID=A0A812P173_9DINO|nr:unnamed protein product [Symbiodinium natans]